jgi:cytochrome c oxidase subunit 3
MTTAPAGVRADTGFSNGALGMWLFLASEAMLFGALFSGYALLRTGAGNWPDPASRLSVGLATVNTLVLLASSGTMLKAVRRTHEGDGAGARAFVAATLALGVVFLAIKTSEWAAHLRAGERPASDTFFAIYFTLTGVHALHVAGGLVTLLWLLVGNQRADRQTRVNRVPLIGLYWQFVDVIWLVLFATLYLW